MFFVINNPKLQRIIPLIRDARTAGRRARGGHYLPFLAFVGIRHSAFGIWHLWHLAFGHLAFWHSRANPALYNHCRCLSGLV